MQKTGIEIEEDVFRLADAYFKNKISGKVLPDGKRDFNSTDEDIVVIFQTGSDGQFQDGSVNINAFVPNKINAKGIYERNIPRIKEISKELSLFRHSLKTGEYKFGQGATIQDFEEPDHATGCYRVNLRLYYNRITF